MAVLVAIGGTGRCAPRISAAIAAAGGGASSVCRCARRQGARRNARCPSRCRRLGLRPRCARRTTRDEERCRQVSRRARHGSERVIRRKRREQVMCITRTVERQHVVNMCRKSRLRERAVRRARAFRDPLRDPGVAGSTARTRDGKDRGSGEGGSAGIGTPSFRRLKISRNRVLAEPVGEAGFDLEGTIGAHQSRAATQKCEPDAGALRQ